jgi:hypothetical protein
MESIIKELKNVGITKRLALVLVFAVILLFSIIITGEIAHSMYSKIKNGEHQCASMFCFNTNTRVKATLKKRGISRGELWYCDKHEPIAGGAIGGALGLVTGMIQIGAVCFVGKSIVEAIKWIKTKQ